MKRKYHYLKGNDNNETVRRLILVDTETDEVELEKGYKGHRLRFGWASFTRRNNKGAWTKPSWKRFTDLADFWLWAMSHTSPKEKTWMWCHNGGFDYPVLDAFCHLPDLGWNLESAIIDAPPLIVKYSMDRYCDPQCKPKVHTGACVKRRKKAKTLVLCDTLNIWRMSLKDLGKKVGLEKLSRPEEWGVTENDDFYCRRDVEIILRSVTGWCDFLRDKDLGGFCPTIAAQAMRSYRHRWMSTRILIDANDSACSLARASYHGGRCECGQIGSFDGDFYLLDVNSMYPYVMSYAEMPVKLVGYSRSTSVYGLRSLLKKYCLCAKVRLNTHIPAFAIVHQNKLCFPVGRFDAHLSTPELQYALDHGFIEDVYECASYDKAVAFGSFAKDLYRYKEEASRVGNVIEARHFKLLLNSFYGKWGQNGRKWQEVGRCDKREFRRALDINAQSGKKTHRRYFGGLIFELAEEGESSHSHPAIAAHICAHARMILWALIEKVPPSEYFYCDTDSLLVSAAGLDKLTDRLDEHSLGGLKIVKRLKHILINGCKDYILDGEQTLKGIRPSAVKIGDKSYRQLKWVGMRGLLRQNSLNMPRTILIDKTLRGTYNKGVVGPDGLVTPLHLECNTE
ncbi:MAG TPA: DNA polymerase [Terriglobales bacterium]